MADELTDDELARLRGIAAFQKVVLGIVMRWRILFILLFFVLSAVFAGYLWMRGSQSVNRYEATTTLLFAPKKVARVDNMGERQLMTVLSRPSLKRRVADKVSMDEAEIACLTFDMTIEQGRRQGNLFTLTAASKTYKGAVAKANAYADLLIAEYVAFRSKDLDTWRKSLEVRRKRLQEIISGIEAEEAAYKAKSGALTPREALVALNALISDQRRNDSALSVDAANEEIKKRKLQASVGDKGMALMENAQTIRRHLASISSLDAELLSLREKYTDLNPRVAGRIQERDERVAELQKFLKSKGVDGIALEKIDQVEKDAAELTECTTRLEAIGEKRLAIAREISDNEKRAAELASAVTDYERLESRREDIATSLHEVDDQLSGISYAIGTQQNDLRQIERTRGSADSGPFGAKRAVFALGGALVISGGVMIVIVILELLFGKVRGGREVSAYDGIEFLGSLPAPGAMQEEEEREALGGVALKTLLAGKNSKLVFVCRLPGAEPNEAFAKAIDFTASMSGASCFLLDIVSGDFKPPEGAEEMICVVRSGARGWFRVANRFAMAPTELEMLKADVAALEESHENVFVRVESGMHFGGTLIDQLIEIADAALLIVGSGTTSRRAFAYARRHLKESRKTVMAVAAGATAKTVRAEMEVMS